MVSAFLPGQPKATPWALLMGLADPSPGQFQLPGAPAAPRVGVVAGVARTLAPEATQAASRYASAHWRSGSLSAEPALPADANPDLNATAETTGLPGSQALLAACVTVPLAPLPGAWAAVPADSRHTQAAPRRRETAALTGGQFSGQPVGERPAEWLESARMARTIRTPQAPSVTLGTAGAPEMDTVGLPEAVGTPEASGLPPVAAQARPVETPAHLHPVSAGSVTRPSPTRTIAPQQDRSPRTGDAPVVSEDGAEALGLPDSTQNRPASLAPSLSPTSQQVRPRLATAEPGSQALQTPQPQADAPVSEDRVLSALPQDTRPEPTHPGLRQERSQPASEGARIAPPGPVADALPTAQGAEVPHPTRSVRAEVAPDRAPQFSPEPAQTQAAQGPGGAPLERQSEAVGVRLIQAAAEGETRVLAPQIHPSPLPPGVAPDRPVPASEAAQAPLSATREYRPQTPVISEQSGPRPAESRIPVSRQDRQPGALQGAGEPPYEDDARPPQSVPPLRASLTATQSDPLISTQVAPGQPVVDGRPRIPEAEVQATGPQGAVQPSADSSTGPGRKTPAQVARPDSAPLTGSSSRQPAPTERAVMTERTVEPREAARAYRQTSVQSDLPSRTALAPDTGGNPAQPATQAPEPPGSARVVPLRATTNGAEPGVRVVSAAGYQDPLAPAENLSDVPAAGARTVSAARPSVTPDGAAPGEALLAQTPLPAQPQREHAPQAGLRRASGTGARRPAAPATESGGTQARTESISVQGPAQKALSQGDSSRVEGVAGPGHHSETSADATPLAAPAGEPRARRQAEAAAPVSTGQQELDAPKSGLSAVREASPVAGTGAPVRPGAEVADGLLRALEQVTHSVELELPAESGPGARLAVEVCDGVARVEISCRTHGEADALRLLAPEARDRLASRGLDLAHFSAHHEQPRGGQEGQSEHQPTLAARTSVPASYSSPQASSSLRAHALRSLHTPAAPPAVLSILA